ncbi:hypothetical protein pE33L466_0358 (plasmid) [Bacillus cereus E33L]|uniref:Uncharacterized protein n=1 Tax=Bacillus cereus (strain ZK / E33L) TaxID=288681 RepID=Q4V1A6_BACCZ|nr:hypothetical protein pE33L466_0358 [Bacillus cereus E33L]
MISYFQKTHRCFKDLFLSKIEAFKKTNVFLRKSDTYIPYLSGLKYGMRCTYREICNNTEIPDQLNDVNELLSNKISHMFIMNNDKKFPII